MSFWETPVRVPAVTQAGLTCSDEIGKYCLKKELWRALGHVERREGLQVFVLSLICTVFWNTRVAIFCALSATRVSCDKSGCTSGYLNS